jgi:Arc/MetJ-type ribon-helix-helix transcriptional regulator
MSNNKYRLNIELTDQVMKRLNKLVVESDSSSKTDVIRKSLALYETIMRIRKEDGQVILLLRDGNQMELVF